jgi:hypothetical protein
VPSKRASNGMPQTRPLILETNSINVSQ